MKKFKLVIVVQTEDDVNREDLVIYSHNEIDGFELTRSTDDDISADFKLISADIESISEYTGNSKEQKIAEIKRIVDTWGSVTMGELTFCDHSPCISSIGNGKNNVSQLIESFKLNCVTAITYQDELELGETEILYEDLSDELIDEILEIMKKHDALMLEDEN